MNFGIVTGDGVFLVRIAVGKSSPFCWRLVDVTIAAFRRTVGPCFLLLLLLPPALSRTGLAQCYRPPFIIKDYTADLPAIATPTLVPLDAARTTTGCPSFNSRSTFSQSCRGNFSSGNRLDRCLDGCLAADNLSESRYLGASNCRQCSANCLSSAGSGSEQDLCFRGSNKCIILLIAV